MTWHSVVTAEELEAMADSRSSIGSDVVRLAGLPPLEYDRVRKPEAERLGVRVGVLDRAVKEARCGSQENGLSGAPLNLADPEPWPDPVDGAEVLDSVDGEIRRYLALPNYAAETIALWIAHAHLLAVARATFDISPRLIFTSPTPRCGKTTALTLVELLSPRALSAANVTPAAVFRAIDLAHPTLIVDEADTLFAGEAEDLRGLLNAGHRTGAGVVRVVGDDHEPRSFDVFGPVALAAIGKLPGTLEDRAVILTMRRRAPGEHVEKLRRRKLDHLGDLKRKLWRWATDNAATLVKAEPVIPDCLHDRAADNWEPLLAIADRAGDGWPVRIREAALALSVTRSDEAESVRVRLLGDIRAIFGARGVDRIASADLVEGLAAMEDAPWGEWGKREKPITAVQLAHLLKAFEVRPKGIRLSDGSTPKGYTLGDFQDAFARYLPPFAPQHRNGAPNNDPNGQTGENGELQQAEAVADRNLGSEPALRAPKADCGGVADRKGLFPAKGIKGVTYDT